MAERGLAIGVDGRELVGRPTGVGRYLASLLTEWARDPSQPHRFSVVVPAPVSPALAALGDSVTWIVRPADRAGTWWEQVRLPRALSRVRPDVFFAPGYTAPLVVPCPFVVAIHDLAYFAHPEWFSWREGLRRRWLTRWAARRAITVLTLSKFSAAELTRHLGIPPSRIRVAPPGAPPAAASDAAPGRAPVVLFVGSLFNRRRIPELVQAFALVVRELPDARLVLVGDNRTRPRIEPRQLASSLGVGGAVDWREYVNDADLHGLYATARVLAFLSDYEGFAMTPLEAFSHGVPAVLLDTPVAREVYDAAAVLVPPDPPAIARALIRLLSDDAAHRELVTASRERLTRFSWARTAALVQRVLEDAAARR